jgi:prepilin signal peptidase PulO-like enzyme (type II secretory pathway)
VNADFFIDLVTALWLGFVGGCIGSFLNVVAYRLPRGLSVVWKPSHCPHCNHPIRARDNIPVLGWLLLRGKCRDCGAPISARYAIVEAILGGVFFVLAYAELFSAGRNLPGGPFSEFSGALDLVWHPEWLIIGLYAYHCAAVTVLLTMALLDRDDQRIPRRLILLAALVGILPPVLLGDCFLFPQLSEIGSYLWQVVAQVLLSIGLCSAIKAMTGMHPEKAFNLAAALSIAGLFLGTSWLFRGAYLATSLLLFGIAKLLLQEGSQPRLADLDIVWLSLVALLVVGYDL